MCRLIFLQPVLKQMIWGGNKLSKNFGYNNNISNIGEAWIVSATKGGECLAECGTFQGMTLDSIYESRKELFGNIGNEKFPILIKYIDADDDLSIQVHPDDEYAMKYEQGKMGKTECWYIIDCESESDIIIGHNAKSREELKNMIYSNKWGELLNVIPIKKGDFFYIPAGTLHAIRKGTVIFEVQQNSDITYRLYDYNRLQNGRPRDLHIEKSIDVIKVPNKFEPIKTTKEHGLDYEKEILIDNDFFRVVKYEVKGNIDIIQKYPFLTFSIIEGEGEIDGISIKKGDNFILTAKAERTSISGNISFITANVNY